MQTKLECPVGSGTVNENAVRATAFLVFVSTAVYFFTPHWSLAGFLAIDFFLRGFNQGHYSLLKKIAAFLVKKWSLPVKPTNKGAKEFAAQIGFVFADMMFILSVAGLYQFSFYMAAFLLLFSFLEAFFGFCAGCYLYTFYKALTRGATYKKVRA